MSITHAEASGPAIDSYVKSRVHHFRRRRQSRKCRPILITALDADAVNAAAGARQHVLGPLDYYALSQDRPEDLKLALAELGADGGRCGNGAVVLNQEE